MNAALYLQGFTELILCFHHTPFASEQLLAVKG